MRKVTTVKVGRNAGTGKFVPVKYAQKHPKTNIVETVKIPKK